MIAQGEFDFEHNLPPGMETFTVRFLGKWFGTSTQHWVRLVEAGEFGDGVVDLRGAGRSKNQIRIPRRVLIEFLKRRKI